MSETLKVHVHFIISGKKTKPKTLKLKKGATGLELLNSINLTPDAFVLIRNEVLMPVNDMLKDGDTVKLLGVVSGG